MENLLLMVHIPDACDKRATCTPWVIKIVSRELCECQDLIVDDSVRRSSGTKHSVRWKGLGDKFDSTEKCLSRILPQMPYFCVIVFWWINPNPTSFDISDNPDIPDSFSLWHASHAQLTKIVIDGDLSIYGHLLDHAYPLDTSIGSTSRTLYAYSV